jgi:small multidrug resistance family-3 protein
MRSLIFFAIAAVGEISGCYTFWAWLRLGKSIVWLIPGLMALIMFATALTRVDTSNAGRAYAAYGGIYILSSLLWLWAVEGIKPDRWDVWGVALSLGGTLIIMAAPHQHP